MIAGARGFLLLTGHLGDPERNPLTVAQFRELTKRMQQMKKPEEDRELTAEDLIAIGCGREFAVRILALLEQQEQLDWYLEHGRGLGCIPITRLDRTYPDRVRKKLAMEAPGSLWAKGDISLLEQPKLSLVGSRELRLENQGFAETAGKLAARHGICLVSGNARGADLTAQESCLQAGGKVISIVADALEKYPSRDNILYLSEEGYDLPFTPLRALSRNRVIHTISPKTLVAQCTLEKGGTWDGTVKNLKNGWSDVYCFRDGSDACRELSQRGAVPVSAQELPNVLFAESAYPNFLNE